MISKKDFDRDYNLVKTLEDVQNIRMTYISKNGLISKMMQDVMNLEISLKKEKAAEINELKTYIFDKINILEKEIREKVFLEKLKEEKIDVTLPGINFTKGTLHPLSIIINDVKNVFHQMGYLAVEGPEIESDEINFEKLNIPKNHPARDMQDTFYINPNYLLRTHTSPAQIRTMLDEKKEEMRIVSFGKVYRRDDDDATHSHQFMQMECLCIGENITIANLKGTLHEFLSRIFDGDVEIRLRPSYFPFTEPSYEVDMQCHKCKGTGCNVCKQTGWIEILGSGMVNPNVFTNVGLDSNKVKGFAFGLGIERIAMIKYGINDIRSFYQNDIRFLKQF